MEYRYTSKKKAEDLYIVEKSAEMIEKAGGRAYLVGGCVRDELLGKECNDYDVEVHGIPVEKLEHLLSEFGECSVQGKSFGIYSVKGYHVDFSLPRTDSKSGLGHRDFSIASDPYMSCEKALLRRDLTVNAMMKDILTGEVIDPYGGKNDLKNRILRAVDRNTFPEDPLRVLRTARFAAQLGFEIDPETVSICKGIDLKNLSPERISAETDKALLSAAPQKYFESLKKMNQLDFWFRELKDLDGLIQNRNYHLEDAWTHTMMVVEKAAGKRLYAEYPLEFMYAALCHDFGKAAVTDPETGKAIGHEMESVRLADSFLSRIKSDRFCRRYVSLLARDHMKPSVLYTDRASDKKIISVLDHNEFYADLMILSDCDRRGKINGPKAEEKKNDVSFAEWADRKTAEFEYWKFRTPHLTGQMLMELGLEPGKNFSEILERARKLEYSQSFEKALKQLSNEYRFDREKVDAVLNGICLKDYER